LSGACRTSGKEKTLLNRIIIVGRLTKDPESQYTSSGIALAKFRVAVDRPTKNPETGEKETDFIDVVAWRRTAEFVTQYITKGRLVAVEGRLQIRNWVDQSGQKRIWPEIVADNVQGLDRPRDAEGGPVAYSANGDEGYGTGAPAPVGAAAPRAASAATADTDDSDPFADE
jgi:single-strand DNA-binding protein